MKHLRKQLGLLILCALFFTPAYSIYNMKTKKEGTPQDVFGKYWLLVSQGCSSCDKVLGQLKTFCSGKKPNTEKIGFFVTGRSEKAMRDKLKDYTDFDIFSGSPGELYNAYGFQGSPSLLKKKKGSLALGQKKIIQALKSDLQFCL